MTFLVTALCLKFNDSVPGVSTSPILYGIFSFLCKIAGIA